MQVLASDGYRNASLASIARAAGISKGLVSHYFSDKETLMEQTAIATIAHLRGEVASAIDLDATAPEIIAAAVHYASQLRRTHSREVRALDQIAHNLRSADGTSLRLDLRAYEETYQTQERSSSAASRRDHCELSTRA